MKLDGAMLSIALATWVGCGAAGAQEAAPDAWSAPDRGAKLAALIPGRKLPAYTPETLFADWTKHQVERWTDEHGALDPAVAYDAFAATAPTDAELVAEFPQHIAPFGRVRSGEPDRAKADNVLISYCPFCRSLALSLNYDTANPYHATTNCCGTELYGREADFPADYELRPTETVGFLHLDGTTVGVPCTVYRDGNGVEWELFIKTIFDQRRWLDIGSNRVRQYGREFRETADPVCAHKIAVILDQVADTYHGLPLCYRNELATGKDGKPLTRAEWEAVPRPAIFEVSYLGPWNRRTPISNQGWLNMSDEHIWVEPYARVRHHPAFRYYSERTYGDADALDRKIRQKLLRELSLMFKSVFGQKLLTNYQEANYVDMWLLGVLLQDRELLDFAGPAQEVTLYNHTYQDGLNGEGAPNYMAMPGGYFYPFLRDPKGWLEYYPTFLEDHPFYHAADGEMRKLHTVRGVQLEFGDQHEHAFPRRFLTDPARVRANEQLGSRNWAGYGVGLLRVGGPGHRQEVSLSYTRATLHNAQDPLSLGCWVDGVPVMRRGGYAAHWSNAYLQWERPEFQALKEMKYPREIAEGPRGFDSWTWVYAHSPLCQNGAMVDDVATGRGWGDNRGYGEVITFKGGELAGEPGSGFQVLDVRDHYSWSRVGKDVRDFRRTLIGVEGPDGRPYVLDLLTLAGGQRHALYSSAWADRGEDDLPEVASTAEDMAEVLFGGELPEDNSHYRNFRQIRKVERLAEPDRTWDLTWHTDAAAYAARELDGSFRRPIPHGVGKVRLRMLGVIQGSAKTELVRGSGPWVGWMRQPLPQGQRVDGNVAFMDARDFLVELREAGPRQPDLKSVFVHVLEGYREGEESAIESITPLDSESLEGEERDVVALELEMTGGHTDTVIYQSAAGAVRLADGTQTDARYALLRRDAGGEVMIAEACRATMLKSQGFEVSMPGDFRGVIEDVVGDLTGTRQESALIVRPDSPWPEGGALHDRQLLVRIESALRDPCNEGYRVEKVTALGGGLVRVDLQDHAPFAESWHQVSVLPTDRPNVIRTNRPMVAHGNTPWYNGLKLWVPERGKTYTISNVNEVGGGFGGDTVELVEQVDLAAEGIEVGDWYVIYGIEPGLRVTVANDFCWRREPAKAWQQHALRAPGTVTVHTAATSGPLAYQKAGGVWQESTEARTTFTAQETGGEAVRIVSGKPDWLELNDGDGPALTALTLDGRAITEDAASDLGWIDPPRELVARFRDAANPLELGALTVRLNGKRLKDEGIVAATASEEGRALEVRVDLAAALAEGPARPRRHLVELSVADRSVGRHATPAAIAFINRVPVDAEATFLSDLTPVKSFAHGGLMRDRDYVGNPAEIAGRIYLKCLTLCPEPGAGGAYGEVVYELSAEESDFIFTAEVGISDSSQGRGSVVFLVETSDAPDGDWQVRYTSPAMRGGQEPLSVAVALEGARYLRLHTTDAGDGINSDHAVWGDAKLK